MGVYPLATHQRDDVVDLDIGLRCAPAVLAVAVSDFPPTFLAGVGGSFQRPLRSISPVEMPQVFLLVVMATALRLQGVGLPAPPADSLYALKARAVRVGAVAAPREGLTYYAQTSTALVANLLAS